MIARPVTVIPLRGLGNRPVQGLWDDAKDYAKSLFSGDVVMSTGAATIQRARELVADMRGDLLAAVKAGDPTNSTFASMRDETQKRVDAWAQLEQQLEAQTTEPMSASMIEAWGSWSGPTMKALGTMVSELHSTGTALSFGVLAKQGQDLPKTLANDVGKGIFDAMPWWGWALIAVGGLGLTLGLVGYGLGPIAKIYSARKGVAGMPRRPRRKKRASRR